MVYDGGVFCGTNPYYVIRTFWSRVSPDGAAERRGRDTPSGVRCAFGVWRRFGNRGQFLVIDVDQVPVIALRLRGGGNSRKVASSSAGLAGFRGACAAMFAVSNTTPPPEVSSTVNSNMAESAGYVAPLNGEVGSNVSSPSHSSTAGPKSSGAAEASWFRGGSTSPAAGSNRWRLRGGQRGLLIDVLRVCVECGRFGRRLRGEFPDVRKRRGRRFPVRGGISPRGEAIDDHFLFREGRIEGVDCGFDDRFRRRLDGRRRFRFRVARHRPAECRR